MDTAQQSHLFKEVDALKHPGPNDADEEDKKKYSDNFIGKLVTNKAFELLTIVVIMANALVIGWDADYDARFGKPENLYDGPIGFIICENIFCVYFTFEILLRLMAYRVLWTCLIDAWFVFDISLVSCMIVETWVLPFGGGSSPLGKLSIFRLLRLLRITRMGKLMRFLPELMMIVKGITAALRAVGWTAVLLLIITYTWAILFTNEYHQGNLTDAETKEAEGIEDFFGSMGKSMLSLLVMGTILDDVTSCTDRIRATGSVAMLCLFLVYILLNSFTMMNMLVGILVEVVGNTAEGEKSRLLEDNVRETILAVFKEMDTDGNGMITESEFKSLRSNKKVSSALKELQINERRFGQYMTLLFEGEPDKRIDFDRLVTMLLRLRPGTPVCALDLAAFKTKAASDSLGIKQRVADIFRLASNVASCETRGPAKDTKATKISVAMIERLARTPTADILAELQRRMGLPYNFENEGVPLALMDDELQKRVKDVEALHALGVPQHECTSWSPQLLTC